MARQPKPILHGRDHSPGGADPIPGMGGGGGIDFDTYPQAGEWLYVETDGAGTSPSGFGMEFFDQGNNGISLACASGSGITIDQFGDTSAGVIINNGQGRFDDDGVSLASGGDNTTIHARGHPTVLIDTVQVFGDSPHQTITLEVAGGPSSSGCNIVIESTDNTITFAFGGGKAILYPSSGTGGLILEMQDNATTPILRVDTGNPAFPFAPEYHIATGGSWVADL